LPARKSLEAGGVEGVDPLDVRNLAGVDALIEVMGQEHRSQRSP
jgi:hypothetical protein